MAEPAKNVVARDEHGRWLRVFRRSRAALGSRNKERGFLRDLQEEQTKWFSRSSGKSSQRSISKAWSSSRQFTASNLASLEFDKPRSVEDALDQPEERVGTKGRRPFEDFLGKAERLRRRRTGK
jgi:hypothetical protein